ncbi:hypothetical protein [Gracilibacillus dipsosauri]|uniref:Uncharacterized protein n=1 Tax=Gracilibacillus dipsosauri TaxID=178340 RepID=A0A317KY17_9BACI|nr:hypothetical protein [Gracilibacillus dipsosauri]PWU66549.1 hypothetical protein DLJ74_19180 [Gracilibacillus dipsosauri]
MNLEDHFVRPHLDLVESEIECMYYNALIAKKKADAGEKVEAEFYAMNALRSLTVVAREAEYKLWADKAIHLDRELKKEEAWRVLNEGITR